MGQPIVQVDAFTDKPFGGNPAAVCILAAPKEADWMQKVAMENNLAETAYLLKQEDGYNLRWFTPAVEVDLCGHATLASAHVLWQEGHLKPDEEARFHTRSGLLTATKKDDWIELNFPAMPVNDFQPDPTILTALGIEKPLYVGTNGTNVLIEVESEAVVRGLKPDFATLGNFKVHGFIVTAIATTPGYDFVSRFFAPSAGINEDPVTGSAHCYLTVYWGKKLGKKEFTAYQASARGGILQVRWEGERVYLGGQAVTTLKGELLV
jgi:PhzF family phenazine biosynthesis protein